MQKGTTGLLFLLVGLWFMFVVIGVISRHDEKSLEARHKYILVKTCIEMKEVTPACKIILETYHDKLQKNN